MIYCTVCIAQCTEHCAIVGLVLYFALCALYIAQCPAISVMHNAQWKPCRNTTATLQKLYRNSRKTPKKLCRDSIETVQCDRGFRDLSVFKQLVH